MPYVIDDHVGFLAPQSKQHLNKKRVYSRSFKIMNLNKNNETLFADMVLNFFKIVSTSVLDGSWIDEDICLKLILLA